MNPGYHKYRNWATAARATTCFVWHKFFFIVYVTQECPDEVFLEGVLQPSLERGRLGSLQGIMEKIDPGLESCSRYLIASCQFLQRRGYFHTLYQIQQFMMVRVFKLFLDFDNNFSK